jgi:hypothetical protein
MNCAYASSADAVFGFDDCVECCPNDDDTKSLAATEHKIRIVQECNRAYHGRPYRRTFFAGAVPRMPAAHD